MVFQSFELFLHLTARANVAVGSKKILKLAKIKVDHRADELLAKVWLTDKASAYPAELSGGQ